MRVLNPNYVPPVNPLVAQLQAWFAANPGVQYVTFAQLRVGLNIPAATDGQIAQALQDAGLRVVE